MLIILAIILVLIGEVGWGVAMGILAAIVTLAIAS